MAMAIPLVVGGVELLWAALGLAAAASAAVLISNSDLPAKVRQWASDNVRTIERDMKRDEEREPTPFTAPSLFYYSSINGTKVAIKQRGEEVWAHDMLHGSHYEVYRSRRDFERGARNRVVTLDGRKMPGASGRI